MHAYPFKPDKNPPEYYPPHPRSDYCIWADEKEDIDAHGGKLREDEDNVQEVLRDKVARVLNSPQSDDFRPHHYVDYIAGTSTGG
jgi:hypothetical protein